MRPKDYIIEFNKLVMGVNKDTFELNRDFVKMVMPDSELNPDIKAEMVLHKSENMFNLHFHLAGTIILECDVCLDEFEMPVNKDFSLIIKLSETERYDDDEIIYITPQTIEFDLRQYLYECIVLSIPAKKECNLSGAKQCNPEVLEKLNGIRSGEEEKSDDESDPRWDKLKGMFN